MKKYMSLILVSSMMLTACSNTTIETDFSEDEESSVVEFAESNLETQTESESLVSETEMTSNYDYIDSTSFSDSAEEIEFNGDVPVVEPTINYDGFTSFSDPDLLGYVEDNVYAQLENDLGSDDYQVVNVNAIYVSQEYIDELAYNTQRNIYFGYTIEEIENQFGDVPYIFTLGENGTTVVQIVEHSEDHYNEIVRNVAIGSGVILVCVTISVVSGGALTGASATAGTYLLNEIFATAAVTAADYAALCGLVSGVAAGVAEGFETGDYQEAIDAGVLAASNGFMWGAITGAIVGGISGYIDAPSWMTEPEGHPSWRTSEADIVSELDALEQVSYLRGEEVEWFTNGATRPDAITINADGTINAIEIKNYDLVNNLSQLRAELERQIRQRIVDLPVGSTQEIYIDVRGRGYSMDFLENTVRPYLLESLSDIYNNIPIVFYVG